MKLFYFCLNSEKLARNMITNWLQLQNYFQEFQWAYIIVMENKRLEMVLIWLYLAHRKTCYNCASLESYFIISGAAFYDKGQW